VIKKWLLEKIDKAMPDVPFGAARNSTGPTVRKKGRRQLPGVTLTATALRRAEGNPKELTMGRIYSLIH
jgi:hypothetical protein